MYLLEVIAFDIESCFAIERAGGHRIELCGSPGEGGTTPSYGLIKIARDRMTVPIFVMVRPRGGDFFYTDEEFEVLMSEIKVCKVFGVQGIVTGVLTQAGHVDTERLQRIVEAAHPLPVTFHRAFDRVLNPIAAIDDIIGAGCTRILTSGQRPTALDGAANIQQYISHSNGRIIIMPGSGVRSDSIVALTNSINAVEFHTSAKKMNSSQMEFINPAMKENLETVGVNEDEVKQILNRLSYIQPN